MVRIVKVLTKTDVSQRLGVTKEMLNELPLYNRKRDVKQIVRAYRANYQSMEMEHDCFEKVLTASDVKRLGVTTTMLEMLPPEDPDRDIPIRVFDNQKRKDYEFKLSSRQRGRSKNPVFQSRGWRVFANDRGIAAGDVLYFWAEEDPFHGTQYRIALYKPNLFPHL
ncbi:unnamed protein product [Prunus armeniaca]|uniref:TF-B3 domain-containing protein n=1 Tax=Prunus armeniaca TaxID=36596 RepID=A0A6J5Y3K9_PRUAR|nr:unnamed protein product [Prunus armeniaca]CAB4320726.1 unnamed protein product [Prunus armeniaca]